MARVSSLRSATLFYNIVDPLGLIIFQFFNCGPSKLIVPYPPKQIRLMISKAKVVVVCQISIHPVKYVTKRATFTSYVWTNISLHITT